MVNPTINSNVGVNVNPQGMEAAAQKVQDQVRKIAMEIERAGQAANSQLKAMAIGLKQVQTLRNYRANETLGGFNNLQTLGRQARALSEYQRGISKTSDAAGVLRGRVAQLNTEFGRLVQQGKTPTKGSLLRAESLDSAAQSYGRLTTQVNNLRARMSLLSDDSKKALQPMLANLDQLDKKNQNLFGQGNRFGFNRQIEQYRKNSVELEKQISLAEKAQKTEALKLQTLRQQARELVQMNALQREADLAATTRAASRRFSNLNLTGGSIYQRDEDQINRKNRATRALVATEARLNRELAKPSAKQNAAYMQTLINRRVTLNRLTGEAIAKENMLAAAQKKARPTGVGGFFAGMKTAPGNLFAEEGGGAFGAGQLVGRVGAYALAAGAIYGVISAFQQGVRTAVQFEDALKQLQAVSASTETEMSRLSSSILEVSRNSANSVLELTESATIIAQAGYAGSEIEGLLQNVVNLSAASGASTSESVDILTSALGSFQLAASESTQVTDALVASLNDSKLSVNQVQLGLQYVGATARLNNITFNELVATLGAMADAGIRSGSTMSTGLRQMLVDFIDPSEKLIENLEKVGLTTSDIDVEVLGLTEVLTRLRDAGFEGYGSLETRAAAAYAVLSSNIPQIEELEQATLRQGAAADAAALRTESLSAKWQQLLNIGVEIGNKLYQKILPALKSLVESLAVVADSISFIIDLTDRIDFSKFIPLARIMGVLSQETQKAGMSSEEFVRQLQAQGVSQEDAAELAHTLATSLHDSETAMRDLKAESSSLRTEQASLRSETQKLIIRQDQYAGANGDLTETTSAVSRELDILANRFPNLRYEFSKTEGGIQGLISAMIALDQQAQRSLGSAATGLMIQARTNINQSVSQRDALMRRYNAHDYSRAATTPEGQQFVEAVRAGNFRTALDLANREGAGGRSIRETFSRDISQLSSIVSSYDLNRSEYNQARNQRDASRFLLTPDGQSVTSILRNDEATTTYTASQGDQASKTSRIASLNQREQQLMEIERRNSGNPAALDAVRQARASLNAQRASLTSSESSSKTGGGSASRSNEAQRLAQEQARIETQLLREETEYLKQLYDNTTEAFENLPDLDQVPDVLQAVDSSLTDWLENEKELSLGEIESLNKRGTLTDAQRTRMEFLAEQRLEQLRVEQVDRLSESLAKIIGNFIEVSTQQIERQYTEALRFTQRNLSVAQGRLDGLSNPVGNQNTPDYMRRVAQGQLDQAQDRANRAQIGANRRRIGQYQGILGELSEERAYLQSQLQSLGLPKDDDIIDVFNRNRYSQGLERIDQRIQDLRLSTEDLIITNEQLEASYAVLDDVPTTFGEGLSMAIEAVRLDIDAADNLGQELIKGLGQPLAELHQSFQGFFSDILSGTVSLGDAFQRMASRIIDSILEMAAVALANQFFKILAGAFGIAAPQASLVGSVSSAMSANPSIFWNGGEVTGRGSGTIRSMYGGGPISSGMTTRDSTLVHAAKEEYLIRRPAAKSLGRGFLDAINARGAMALNGLKTPQMMLNSTPVETNVYVIAPEEKPTMGPNDVLATFSSDVLKGGVTKKLIKKVAAGG